MQDQPYVDFDYDCEDKKPMAAIKNDSEKPDLSLIPRPAMEAIARALMFGEKKYHRYNYLKGMEYHRLVAAAMRHLTAWQDGETLDPESGLSHLDHATASLAMLIDMIAKGVGTDTRLKLGET